MSVWETLVLNKGKEKSWSDMRFAFFSLNQHGLGLVLLLSFGMSLTAPVEDSAPQRTISCQYNHAEFLLHCTVD